MIDEAALRSRYSLVEVDEEGVLFDRESGAMFQLNQTACAIWKALFAGDSVPTIADTLTQRFGIAADLAERDTLAALVDIPIGKFSSHEAGATKITGCRWEESRSGYVFRESGVVTCEVDRQGSTLRLPEGTRPSETEARARLQSVVARVLALRGIHLLHASAVETDGALTVFTGPSGAGKTTTARAFARTGARLVSEDLLVLARAPVNRSAVVSGEITIRKWVAAQAARLASLPDQAIACEDLDRCTDGETLPILQIVLIDAARRAGDEVRLQLLSRPDALVALMESIYFASSDADTWRARLDPLCRLVGVARSWKATVPDGLSSLERALSAFRQSAMIAS